jgi:hypothetical protein
MTYKGIETSQRWTEVAIRGLKLDIIEIMDI